MAAQKKYADDELCQKWYYAANNHCDITAARIAQYAMGSDRSDLVPKTIRTRKQARLAVQSWQDAADAQKEGA